MNKILQQPFITMAQMKICTPLHLFAACCHLTWQIATWHEGAKRCKMRQPLSCWQRM